MKFIWVFIFLVSCSRHVPDLPPVKKESCPHLYVDAKGLDYSSTESFIRSMSLNDGEVGHAWLTLRFKDKVITGGHSGERGITQLRYCDAIQNNLDTGCQNPIQCLWEPQKDGFFQAGSGGHKATYSLKIPLTDATAKKIIKFIQNYPFMEYSLTGNQCTAFCVQAAAIAGVYLEDRVTLPLSQYVRLKGKRYKLWSDPTFREISFSSPDILQESMKKFSWRRKLAF